MSDIPQAQDALVSGHCFPLSGVLCDSCNNTLFHSSVKSAREHMGLLQVLSPDLVN